MILLASGRGGIQVAIGRRGDQDGKEEAQDSEDSGLGRRQTVGTDSLGGRARRLLYSTYGG